MDSRDENPIPNALHFLGKVPEGPKTVYKMSKSGVEMGQIRMSKASKQYMFDTDGVEYLDCINGTAHVGHCHPQVVAAGQCQLARLTTAQGFLSDSLSKYVKQLATTLPESLNVVYLCNSGSEANDLAIRLARQYRGNNDIICVDGSFHGNLGLLVDISPKMHTLMPNYEKKDFVHVAPLPDFYRGKYKLSEKGNEAEREREMERLAMKYADDLEEMVREVRANGRTIAGFICEPLFVIPGLHIVPRSYFQRVYQIIHENGGIVIADEVQSGLGRTGKNMWGFQQYGVVPDIVTIGRPLGNGHPMAAVICKKEVSTKLGGYYSTFGGNPVSCAMGLAVLEVLHNEKLMSSANSVGTILHGFLLNLKAEHPDEIGDVRGQGLLWTIDIIKDRIRRLPSPKKATDIMIRMKEEKILIGTTGEFRNILFFSPPLCFTIENCTTFIKTLDSVINKLKVMECTSSDEEDAGSNVENCYSIQKSGCLRTANGIEVSRKRTLSGGGDETVAKRSNVVEHNKYNDLD